MSSDPEMRSSPEFDLIRAVRERLGSPSSERLLRGIGDDAAVTVPGGATATSVDAVVEGVHFRSSWCPPEAVGHKAMAAALSDLAAMGAEPGEAYVWLGKPAEMSVEHCLQLAGGLASAAGEQGVTIAGGDLTASPVLAVSVTVVGHADRPGQLIGRDGAGAGEAVAITGPLGGAAAGLVLLEHPELAVELGPELGGPLREQQLRPRPRLAEGRALAAAGVSAMIDLSDGLGADSEHLAAASGVGLEIALERVPLAPGVEELARLAGRDPLELAVSGGEDYELLCTIPRAALERGGQGRAEGRTGLIEIGATGAGSGVRLRLPGGRVLAPRGHDHLGR